MKIAHQPRVVWRPGGKADGVPEKQRALKEELREAQLQLPALPFTRCAIMGM